MATETETVIDTDIEDMLKEALSNSKRFRLLLLNDEVHGMDEVAAQIQKAIRCSRDKALRIMATAHTEGQAEVLVGSKEEAEKAGRVLEEIGLGIDIEAID